MKNSLYILGAAISFMIFGFAAGVTTTAAPKQECLISFNGEHSKKMINERLEDGWTVKMMCNNPGVGGGCLVVIFEK